MFVSNRREKSNSKINELETEQKVLKARIDYIEEPVKTIQKEMLIKFLRTTYDTPENVLRNIGIDQK